MYIKNKTWQVNAQLIDSVKYLHAKHLIKGCKLIRQTCNMINCQGASSYFLSGAYEHYALSLSGHLPASPSPRLTIWFLTMMMKHGYIGRSAPGLIRLTQHKVQYTITTLMGNIHLGY